MADAMFTLLRRRLPGERDVLPGHHDFAGLLCRVGDGLCGLPAYTAPQTWEWTPVLPCTAVGTVAGAVDMVGAGMEGTR
jgi:hypothetical protein